MNVYFRNLVELAAITFGILITPIGASASPFYDRFYYGPAYPDRYDNGTVQDDEDSDDAPGLYDIYYPPRR